MGRIASHIHAHANVLVEREICQRLLLFFLQPCHHRYHQSSTILAAAWHIRNHPLHKAETTPLVNCFFCLSLCNFAPTEHWLLIHVLNKPSTKQGADTWYRNQLRYWTGTWPVFIVKVYDIYFMSSNNKYLTFNSIILNFKQSLSQTPAVRTVLMSVTAKVVATDYVHCQLNC